MPAASGPQRIALKGHWTSGERESNYLVNGLGKTWLIFVERNKGESLSPLYTQGNFRGNEYLNTNSSRKPK